MSIVTEFHSRSPEETLKKGNEYGGELRPGDVVILTGPLGSGKTHFVKGICSRYGIEDQVSSPSFIIVNEYEGNSGGSYIKLNHFDLYRINSESELDEIGIAEYFNDNAICLIEWGETAAGRFPGAKKVIMNYGEHESERIIRFA